MNYLICVFCSEVYNDIQVCPECHDYKGLMALSEGVAYLGNDPADYHELWQVDSGELMKP